MAKFNIREQDPQKYSAVKAEQDKLSAHLRCSDEDSEDLSVLRAYGFHRL